MARGCHLSFALHHCRLSFAPMAPFIHTAPLPPVTLCRCHCHLLAARRACHVAHPSSCLHDRQLPVTHRTPARSVLASVRGIEETGGRQWRRAKEGDVVQAACERPRREAGDGAGRGERRATEAQGESTGCGAGCIERQAVKACMLKHSLLLQHAPACEAVGVTVSVSLVATRTRRRS